MKTIRDNRISNSFNLILDNRPKDQMGRGKVYHCEKLKKTGYQCFHTYRMTKEAGLRYGKGIETVF